MGRISKSGGLHAVDCLSESAMEKNILDIELVNRPLVGQCQGENSADCRGLDNGAESLVIVKSGPLCKAVKNPVSLIPIKRAIRTKLVMINPLASDNNDVRRARNQTPYVVGLKCLELLRHHCVPVRITKSGAESRREW